MKSLFIRLIEWYRRNYVPYITICAATEHMFISKALWHDIVRHIPVQERKDLRVFFEKYPVFTYVGQGTNRRMAYRFFVNSDLSAIHTPDGGEPFTTQIQFGRFGHIGFQAVQPTAIEVLTEYGIADQYFCKNSFSHYVRLRVDTEYVNGDPCYVITPSQIGDHYRPKSFCDIEPDPRRLINPHADE